mmetsp:Transcript_79934/g.226124  ORF Transcript_79934/g.226124 Transcript_79934/m.226124 type:complete len:214 (-) Transcript_79934:82-723(-)
MAEVRHIARPRQGGHVGRHAALIAGPDDPGQAPAEAPRLHARRQVLSSCNPPMAMVPVQGAYDGLLRVADATVDRAVRGELLAGVRFGCPADGSLAVPVLYAGIGPQLQHQLDHGGVAAVSRIKQRRLLQKPIDVVDVATSLHKQLQAVHVLGDSQPVHGRLAALVHLPRRHSVHIQEQLADLQGLVRALHGIKEQVLIDTVEEGAYPRAGQA